MNLHNMSGMLYRNVIFKEDQKIEYIYKGPLQTVVFLNLRISIKTINRNASK